MKLRTIATILLSLVVICAGCKAPEKKEKDKAAAKAKKDQAEAEANPEVDFQAFVGRLRKAVQARDMQAIAQMMISDFAFVMGSTAEQDRKGEGVFQYWDENGLWPELEGILAEKFVKKGDYMVAPPQFANSAIDYDGYRAGIRRVNGSWKFVYFVNGSTQQ
ncbi:MAG: hypothetical protein ACXWAV_06725 [Chthoniobacterales bacterium]